MSTAPLFPSFDGLLNLSKHEGVDIRPTLLRVLTDLYVQAHAHTDDEKRQFTELVSRLIEDVDDATRAAVRAKLLLCTDTPAAIAAKLGFTVPAPRTNATPANVAHGIEMPDTSRSASVNRSRQRLTMRPHDAAEIDRMFLAASAKERIQILESLETSPLIPAVRPGPRRAARSVEALEMAAFASDRESFAAELSNILLLPGRVGIAIIETPGGEPLACACKAIGMPAHIFQRVLLFLDPVLGSSVFEVFRLARLYDVLAERAALIMVTVWRGATMAQAPRARHQPIFYDDERRSARGGSQHHRPSSETPSLPATDRSRASG